MSIFFYKSVIPPNRSDYRPRGNFHFLIWTKAHQNSKTGAVLKYAMFQIKLDTTSSCQRQIVSNERWWAKFCILPGISDKLLATLAVGIWRLVCQERKPQKAAAEKSQFYDCQKKYAYLSVGSSPSPIRALWTMLLGELCNSIIQLSANNLPLPSPSSSP